MKLTEFESIFRAAGASKSPCLSGSVFNSACHPLAAFEAARGGFRATDGRQGGAGGIEELRSAEAPRSEILD